MARTEPAGPAQRGPGRALRATRPRQWSKNLLVLAAPCSPGGSPRSACWPTPCAFVVFSLASSGIYLVNDVLDLETDRFHPDKRLRPIAAGPWVRGRREGSAVLSVAALLVALIAGPALAMVVGFYLVLPAVLPLAQGRAGDGHRHHRQSGSCCGPSPAAPPLASSSRSGSCSPRPSARSSWPPASGTPSSSGGRRRAGPAGLAGAATPRVPALRVDDARPAADHDLRPVGLRDRRAAVGAGGTRGRWRRSCWRCSATRSTSTADGG